MTKKPQKTLNRPIALTPEEIVAQLRILREQMPDQPTPVQKGRSPLHSVNPHFVQAAVNAAGTSESVTVALGRTGEELQQEIDMDGRWTAVSDELRSILLEVLTGNAARRQRLGLAALQTYQICQQLARDDERHAGLAVHIEEMRRLNRFGRRRRKAEAEADAAPSPDA